MTKTKNAYINKEIEEMRNRLLKPEEVVDFFGVSRQKLISDTKRGLPHFRLGYKTYRFVYDDVVDWYEKNSK